MTIAPRVEPQEITWQLIEASIAVSIGSACSVRTSVRNEASLKLYADGSHIFAAARDARAHGSSRDATHLPRDRWRFSRP